MTVAADARRTRPASLRGIVLVAATAALVVIAVVSLFAGSKATGVGDVLTALGGGGDAFTREVVAARIPRTVLGMLVGGALAVAGVIVQGVTRNPLGDPGLLGVTVGASAAVVTAVALFDATGGALVLAALPGALLAALLVVAIGARSRGMVTLILAGAALSAVLGAYIQAMTLLQPKVFDSFRHWVVGSLAGRGLDTAAQVAPLLVLGFVLAIVLAPGLNSLALGDDVAAAQGVHVQRVRWGGIGAAALLCAAATAAVGPIAFVGLAVPHVARALVGPDHRWQLPTALLLGAGMLLAADIVARVIARPGELMVGIVTAFVGAPFLLVAVRRGKALT
ncbi:FecCD family ABC transporter permease [Leifsonia aquatica]|uniref:FecCD family ABC transporter permease n=1 Tax=Leifsonia aquatica TaxID=144185 RepID=UPI0028A926D2|nr:iron ABC transporter permease [Leifsonia aquatica]